MVLIRTVFIFGLVALSLSACQSLRYDSTEVVPAPEQPGEAGPEPRSSVTQSRLPEPVPNHASARLPVVSTLLTQCRTLMENGNWTQAQQRVEQALRLAPQDPGVYLAYGDWFAGQKNVASAREMYQRARSLSGKDSPEAQSAREKLEKL